jgi:transcriptional regulator with XRE-family HTH domain
MAEAISLGTWLRRERERRGVTLTEISDQTKLSVPLLQGLEADDLSRWPGGIFRRSFARSYAAAIGVDPDLVVRRIEEEHPRGDAVPVIAAGAPVMQPPAASMAAPAGQQISRQSRAVATILDLLVAGAIGLGFAAAGSRLLWPVLAIATYHALGVFLTGRSPMLTLILDQRETGTAEAPAVAVPSTDSAPPAPRHEFTSTARTSTARLRQPARRGSRAGLRGRGAGVN